MVAVVSNVSHKNSRQCGELLMRAAKHRGSHMKRTIWEPSLVEEPSPGGFSVMCGVVLASSNSDNMCIHSLNFYLTSNNYIWLISLLDPNLSVAIDRVLVLATNKQLYVLQNRLPHFIRQFRQIHL